MMRLMTASFIFLIAHAAAAHPSVSVVMDRRGNIYFSDLKQVWQLSPLGKKRIAVAGVHTHELYVDTNDNLFGEHLWYEGEAIDKWGHYVWRRSPDGKVDKVIAAREGFLKDYSFVRDQHGVMYWADDDRKKIYKRLPNGRVVKHAEGSLRRIGWMTAQPDGTLYVVDDGAVKRISGEGRVVTLASKVRSASWGDLVTMGPSHDIQGIWTDRRDNVYLAVAGSRMVKRIDASGKVTVILKLRAPWIPTGGLVAPNGDLWIQEVSNPFAVRLRKIDARGRHHIY